MRLPGSGRRRYTAGMVSRPRLGVPGRGVRELGGARRRLRGGVRLLAWAFCLLAAGAGAVSAPSQAPTQDNQFFRNPDAGVQFRQPDGWTSGTNGGLVTLTAPDRQTSIRLWTEAGVSYDSAVATLQSEIASRLSACQVTTAAHAATVNGLPVQSLSGTALDKAAPIVWRGDLLNAKEPVVILVSGPAGDLVTYAADIAAFQQSLALEGADNSSPGAAAAGAANSPPPTAFQDQIAPAQLAFLIADEGVAAKKIVGEKPFRQLVKQVTPRTTFHYGRDMSITDAMDMVFDGSTAPLLVRDGRYAMLAGWNGPYLRGRGFWWFDTHTGQALGAFYFQPTNGEPSPTLTVFSKQLTDTDLSLGQLPPAFVRDLREWAQLGQIPAITPRYFIPANGKKYPLLHDEDYCAPRPGAAAAPADICQQLTAEAADADVDAAYFMKETHDAANATAWMLGPDQVAWIAYRNRTCGAGLACRITVTHERIRVLLARQPESRAPR